MPAHEPKHVLTYLLCCKHIMNSSAWHETVAHAQNITACPRQLAYAPNYAIHCRLAKLSLHQHLRPPRGHRYAAIHKTNYSCTAQSAYNINSARPAAIKTTDTTKRDYPNTSTAQLGPCLVVIIYSTCTHTATSANIHAGSTEYNANCDLRKTSQARSHTPQILIVATHQRA